MQYFYILILFIALNANATKWAESFVDDPIMQGSKCSVYEVLSSGSYIYDWPSKYDQIFFPYTSSAAIWFCKESGYISFMRDFDNVTAEEKIKISNYLKANPQINIRSLLSKLKLLETIYSLREVSLELSNKNKRILAYLYEQKDKIELANSLRRSALLEINELLTAELTKYKRLEYLYVAANYERQLGNISNSDLRLKTLKNEIENINSEELKWFGSYLSKLATDTLRIKPGGKLEPIVEKVEVPHSQNKIEKWIDNSSDECKTEIQSFYQDIEPLFTTHLNQTIVNKSIDELLNVREELISTGDVSQHTFKGYSSYNGFDNTFQNKINSFKSRVSVPCKREITTFSEKVLLDFKNHMRLVVEDIASDLGRVKRAILDKGSDGGRREIDLLLLENSNHKLYCYERDYDVFIHEICPEKSSPYKNIFVKVKANILKVPLKVEDEVELKKLWAGFSSIGI